jgi:hypothetical protein
MHNLFPCNFWCAASLGHGYASVKISSLVLFCSLSSFELGQFNLRGFEFS